MDNYRIKRRARSDSLFSAEYLEVPMIGPEETVKSNLQTILFRNDFCCICLDIGSVNSLWGQDTEEVTRIDKMIRVFGEKIMEDLPNRFICEQCEEELNDAYKFIAKVDKSTQTINLYYEQISSKVDEAMEVVNKSGEQELDSFVIMVQNPNEVKREPFFDISDMSSDDDQGNSSQATSTQPIPRIKCSKCDKRFNTKKESAIHNRREHFTEDEKKLRRKNLMLKRTKITKFGQKLHRKCYLCPATFSKNKDLSAHLSSNHSPDEKYFCEYCNGFYDTRIAYIRHIYSYGHLKRLNPEMELPFKCEHCTMSFGSSNELESHTNAKHLNQRPYSCHVCGKLFAASSHLESHVERHNNTPNYKCSICDKHFTVNSGLKAHNLRFHNTDSRPIACEHCGKTFINQYQCKIHQQREHLPKSFTCPICASMFHTLSNMKIHIKRVHFKKLTMKEYMDLKGYSKELEEIFTDRRLLPMKIEDSEIQDSARMVGIVI